MHLQIKIVKIIELYVFAYKNDSLIRFRFSIAKSEKGWLEEVVKK